eukprot:16978-Heterococcus_DN1.PRE.4
MLPSVRRLSASLLKTPSKQCRVAASVGSRYKTTASRDDHSDVVVVSFARTPIGSFMGSLSSMTAPQLGAAAVKEAVKRTGIDVNLVEEAFLGNVVSAGLGQAPARQAVIYAGLPKSVICTTVNKVCASGMKAAMLGAQSIQLGQNSVVIAGGFESMSNIPHYLPNSRSGFKMGNTQLIDGMIHDGLWDCYNNQHMGLCAEACADSHGFSREQQDDFALESYKRAAAAWDSGKFNEEVLQLEVPQKRGAAVTVTKDQEYTAVDANKVRSVRPAFKKDGSVTAPNASTLNDGAAAMVLMSMARAKELGCTPLARILSYADAARDPVEFTIAPSDAVPLALKRAGLSTSDCDYHEINEAFAVVALANMQRLKLDHAKVNVNGGAVALGHPLGASGARIMGALYTVLKQQDGSIGTASICNGGGGASAIVLERLN